MRHPIVIADDEPHILRLLGMALGKAGFETISAVDGEEALARIRERRPAIVLLDGEMPRLSGYDVARAVRADPDLVPQPRILMLTAGGQPADAERARVAGVDEFLTKPFSPRQLVARLNAILVEIES